MEEDFGGINECTHEESTKNEKYANGSVGARVRLMVRGGFLPVTDSKQWNGNMMMISVCVDKRN